MITRYIGFLFSEDRDSFCLKQVLLAIIFVIGLKVLMYAELHTGDGVLKLLVWMMFLVYLLFGFGFLIAAALNAFRRKFKAGLSTFLAAAIFAGVPYYPIHEIIDLSRLLLFESHYLKVVKSSPPTERAPQVHFFNWGSSGSFNVTYIFFLVYDDSGEIALPRERRSAAWNRQALNTYPLLDDDGCQSESAPLRNSFYSVVTLCQ